VTVLAGTGQTLLPFVEGALAAGSQLDRVNNLAVDNAGNIYYSGRDQVIRIAADGTVHRFAGTGTSATRAMAAKR